MVKAACLEEVAGAGLGQEKGPQVDREEGTVHIPVRGPVAPQGNGLEGKGEGEPLLCDTGPLSLSGDWAIISCTLGHAGQALSRLGGRVLPWASVRWGQESRCCSRSHGG